MQIFLHLALKRTNYQVGYTLASIQCAALAMLFALGLAQQNLKANADGSIDLYIHNQ